MPPAAPRSARRPGHGSAGAAGRERGPQAGSPNALRAAAAAAAFGLACAGVAVDPGEAGPDFAVQGEYAGADLGAQVVALGEGRFEAHFLPGGLPGAGWTGAPRIPVPGERRGSETSFAGALHARVVDGELRGTREDGSAFALQRVERASPTLGAPPPAGAVVLFDGTGLGGFEGHQDSAGNLAAGANTRDRFQSFELHLEFRTPFMPDYRGQRRGNSGVFLQNRYEIQVLDSFGLEGSARDCGALYGQRAPDLNMTLPPLSWQTYDVVFEAARFDASGRKTLPARVTLRHNGVLVHEGVQLAGPMDDGDPEGPAAGPLHLQDLWIPVAYRNVWLRPLERAR